MTVPRLFPERHRRARVPGDVAAHPRPAQRRRHLLGGGDRGRLHARPGGGQPRRRRGQRAAHARRRPARLCIHRARDRGVRRPERHPLLRLAVRSRGAAVRAALARRPAARAGARGADVPHGHVAPVPGPRHGAERAHGGRDGGPAVRGQPRRGRRRRRPHPVGPHPPVGNAGRGAVRRRRQRGRGPDRLRESDGSGRRRGGHRGGAGPRVVGGFAPARLLGPSLRPGRLLRACPWRCCGSVSPTWRSRRRPSPSAPSCASTCSGWRRAPRPACRWRAACATRCGPSCDARPGSWCGRAGRWSPSRGCRPWLPPFPTLLEYWSAPRPFNLGDGLERGHAHPPVCRGPGVPLRRADVPHGDVVRRPAARGARRRADERPQGRGAPGLQHRGVRGRARSSSASARWAGGGPRGRCAR